MSIVSSGRTSVDERKRDDLPETPKKKGTVILSPLLRNQQPNNSDANSKRTFEAISRHQSLALKLKAKRLLPRYCTTLPLKMNYLKMILDGRKTVEGRVNTGLPARTRVNDTILFFSGDVCCLTQVVEKRQFSTFRAMLDHYGITTCLPDFTGDLSAAERLYRSFPGYAQKERDFGVLGLKLRVMDQEEMENMDRTTTSSHVQSNHPVSVSGNGREGPPPYRVNYANHNESHANSRHSLDQRHEIDLPDDSKLSGKRRGRDEDESHSDRTAASTRHENGDSRGGSRKKRERERDDDADDSKKRRR
jgi:ASC-1-like (ASCH) protein